MSSSSDRPRANRFKARIPGTIRVSGRIISIETRSISRSGVLLAGEFPPNVEGRVDLTLKGPASVSELHLTGTVVRRIPPPAEGGPAGLAILLDAPGDGERDDFEVLLMRVIESLQPPETGLAALKPGTAPHEVRKALEAIPLGERIVLAARASPRDIDFLRQDVNPVVLDSLARNPNLTPAEAGLLAGSQHVTTRTLEFLADDPRWTGDPALRALVAAHPRAPLALADRIIATLQPPALHRMLQAPRLSPVARERVQRKLARGGR